MSLRIIKDVNATSVVVGDDLSLPVFGALPSTGKSPGSLIYVASSGELYYWDGSSWVQVATGGSITLEAKGVPLGVPLVKPSPQPGPVFKVQDLMAGPGVFLDGTPADSVTIGTNIQVSSIGTGTALVNNQVAGHSIQVKTLSAAPGGGLTVSDLGNQVEIASNYTLSSSGTGNSLVNGTQTGPNFVVKGLLQGDGISLTGDPNSVTIESSALNSISPANWKAGTNSSVGTGSDNVVIGDSAVGTGTTGNSVAIGASSSVTDDSIAIGQGAQALASNSIAIGKGVVNSVTNTALIGNSPSFVVKSSGLLQSASQEVVVVGASGVGSYGGGGAGNVIVLNNTPIYDPYSMYDSSTSKINLRTPGCAYCVLFNCIVGLQSLDNPEVIIDIKHDRTGSSPSLGIISGRAVFQFTESGNNLAGGQKTRTLTVTAVVVTGDFDPNVENDKVYAFVRNNAALNLLIDAFSYISVYRIA